MTQLNVALIQSPFSSDKNDNLERLAQHIAIAAQKQAQLILLPELHATPYFCQVADPENFALSEPLNGPTVTRLQTLAKQYQVVIVGSIFEQRAAGLYHNTAVVIEQDGRLAGLYRKMHIPDDPGYYEKFYFTPGDLDFTPINTSLGRLGVLVCWDQWFPEAARLMTLAGADLLLYPTAIGYEPSDPVDEQQRQKEAWIISQRAHGIANGLPVLACNRVGYEPHPNQKDGIAFWGNSFVCGPQGELLAQADEQEMILLTRVDLARSRTVRNIWPFLRDRRIDAYGNLLKRFN
jgi:N-carbamoylputrescine amidase